MKPLLSSRTPSHITLLSETDLRILYNLPESNLTGNTHSTLYGFNYHPVQEKTIPVPSVVNYMPKTVLHSESHNVQEKTAATHPSQVHSPFTRKEEDSAKVQSPKKNTTKLNRKRESNIKSYYEYPLTDEQSFDYADVYHVQNELINH